MTATETTRSAYLAESRRLFRKLCRLRCEEAQERVRRYCSYRPNAEPEVIDEEDALRMFWLAGACLVFSNLGFPVPYSAAEVIHSGVFRVPGGDGDLMELETEIDAGTFPLVPIEEFFQD